MGYKVIISTGQGKYRARTGSLVLPNKESVAQYVKRSPLGNYKTKITVEDVSSGKIMTGRKIRFQNPVRW
jgi:gentisate 1,2-dioxygenase